MTSSRKAHIAAVTLAAFAMVAPVAVADWVAKDGTGSIITFDAYLNGTENLPKHVIASPTGVIIGTPTNPLITTLSSTGPLSTVNAQQQGAWTMGVAQSSAFNVTQASPPWNVSNGGTPWAVAQSGAWAFGQSGTWNVGLAAGSNSIGNVSQNAGPWSYNLAQVNGAIPSLTNPTQVQLSLANVAVASGNPMPSSCISGCTSAEGASPTYAVGVTWAIPASSTDIASFQGSATKIIRIQKILVTITSGSPLTSAVNVTRRTAMSSGGTSSAPVIGKMDKNDPAPTAVFRTYTANPAVVGPSAGDLLVAAVPINLAGASANMTPSQIYSFGGGERKPIILRGTSDVLGFGFSGTQAVTFKMTIEWTEDDT